MYPLTDEDVEMVKGDDPERGHIKLTQPIPFFTNSVQDLYVSSSSLGLVTNHESSLPICFF